nr:hypothetical protein [uncultured Desulfobacter sp.]
MIPTQILEKNRISNVLKAMVLYAIFGHQASFWGELFFIQPMQGQQAVELPRSKIGFLCCFTHSVVDLRWQTGQIENFKSIDPHTGLAFWHFYCLSHR